MTFSIVTVLVLASALMVGLLLNGKVRPFAHSEVQGVKLELLISPLLTLTALLLAFVLVQSFSSFNRAKLSAGDEAGRVVAEFRLFGYLDDEHTPVAQSALVCYARAVTELEWPMLRGQLAASPEVFHWGGQLATILTRLAAERPSQPYGNIVATDRDRGDARRRRIAESRPAVPEPVTWLMLAVSAIAVLSIATFTLPYVARRVQTGALALMTLVFAGMQIGIMEIDSKYDGWIRVQPDEMRFISDLMETNLSRRYPGIELPCDAQGRPL